jgi:hypothetical protein
MPGGKQIEPLYDAPMKYYNSVILSSRTTEIVVNTGPKHLL